MQKSLEAKIGDLSVTTVKHPVMRGLALKARLFAMLAPALKHLDALESAAKGQSVADMSLPALAPVLTALAGTLDPNTLPDLVVEILSGTTVTVPGADGKPTLMDLDRTGIEAVFNSRPDTLLFQVIGHALKANFTGFFGIARGVLNG